MMNIMNQTAIFKQKQTRYFKEISDLLPKSYTSKSILLHELEQNIQLYLEEHPDAMWEDILQEFGSPTEIAGSVLADEPDTEPTATAKSRKHLHLHLVFIVICFTVVLCIIGYEYYWVHFRMYRTAPSHYYYNGTEVSSEELDEKMSVKE